MSRDISLALSGGGSRAIAFHLGCLRSLRRNKLLGKVETISSVSGGSVIAAAYCKYGSDFDEFENKIITILKSGLFYPTLKTVFSLWGGYWIISEAIILTVNITLVIVGLILKLIKKILSLLGYKIWNSYTFGWGVRRFISRTTLLEKTLERLLYGQDTLDLYSNGKLNLIINATELTTGSAFRFSTISSGSWRFGEIKNQKIKVSHAVAASAAYPLFLTHYQEKYQFTRKDGAKYNAIVSLTDGGIYDNLGLGPLWPDRSHSVSYNITRSQKIICCCAGYGIRSDEHPKYWLSRMMQTFYTTFDRAQNAAIDKLLKLQQDGKIEFLIFPYLGMRDEKLFCKYPNFISREEVHDYPTNFFGMSDDNILKIGLRGEQLTDILLDRHLK